jgi:hypothetical protein
MKNKIMSTPMATKSLGYVTPTVEVVTAMVEMGFNASNTPDEPSNQAPSPWEDM